jgi:hypothetical protein
MRIALPVALLALASPAGAAEQRIMVNDFDRVQVEGPYRVTLTVGGTSAAVATGSRSALDRVSVEVQGRTLRIRPNRSAWGGYPGEEGGGPVEIRATTRELRAGIIIGSGSLTVDRAKGLRIELSVSGSGRLGVAAVEADQLIVNLRGSGKILLGGKARQLRAAVEGNADLDAGSFRAEHADVTADTAGAIALTALQTARIRANGTGEVAIGGTAACTVSGPAAGGVSCGRSGTDYRP